MPSLPDRIKQWFAKPRSLPERITEFIQRKPPPEINYVPGSLVEMVLATYAAEGKLDEEGTEMLHLCKIELDAAVARKTGAAKAYFAECAGLVEEVLQAL